MELWQLQVSLEWNFLEPDWYLYRSLLSDRKFIVWSWTIHSIYNLRDKWKQRDGPEVLWVSFETFFIQRFIFATLYLSGKEASMMERLQILAIGVQSIFELSLRNLLIIFSTSVALLVLNSFSILRIDAKVTFSNISFFFTENNFLVILTHWRYFKFSSRVRKFLKKITWKIHSMFLKSICTCRGRKRQLLKKLRKRQAYKSRLVW